MSQGIARTLRLLPAGEQAAKPARYWRTRPLSERLQATLNLHREGNVLFKNGNPPFSYIIRHSDRSSDVGDQ